METDKLRAVALVALVGSSLGLISSVVLPDWTLSLLIIGGVLLLVGFSIYVVYATRVLVGLLPTDPTDTQHRPS